MGKKNESKYDKLTYTAKRAADKRMAEQYGIDLSNYGNTERPGASYSGKKDWDDLSADVARAAANDYDVRRTIEAAQLSGNKKAQKVGSISNASEAYAATRFMEKTHKNRMGNGGAYDGANDQGNVTDYWVNKDRNKFTESLTPAVPDEEQTATTVTPDEPYKPSEELVKAREVVQAWESGETNVSPYGVKASPSSDAYGAAASAVKSGGVSTNVDEFASKVANRDNNKKGAQAFADDYLADFKQAVPMKRQF